VTRGPVTGRLLVSEGTPSAVRVRYPIIVDEVEVVERGPVQVTVYLKGRYGSTETATPLVWEKKVPRYPFHGFVRMYADSGRMDLIHSFGYNADEDTDFVRAYGLAVPVSGAGGTFVYGGTKGSERRFRWSAD